MSELKFSFKFESKADRRLDKFLSESLPDYSRSRLQGLIRDGKVTVNGSPVTKTGFSLAQNDLIEITITVSQPVGLIPEDLPFPVIFENDDLILVNKPAGMVVHPAAGHSTGTLVHAALAHAPEMEGVGGELRPGVVHRLDKETSGLILMAKNDHSHQWLQNQFRSRKVKKVYLALVDGKPPTPTGRVEAPIGRDLAHRKQMAIVPLEKGREAVTEYYTLESFSNHTLIEAHPLTGRTHQIRLHLAFIGCPIVGDMLYGHRRQTLQMKRQFLHAARLTVTIPGEKTPRTFEAPLPADLQQALDILRGVRPPTIDDGEMGTDKELQDGFC